MDKKLITLILKEQDLFDNSSSIEFKPLEGGVSSDICLITDGDETYVVKQALPKLQVRDDWFADTSRNSLEQDFVRYLQEHRPDAVPRLIYSNSEHPFFVMEYLGNTFRNWKQEMLKGVFVVETVEKAAGLLADIHYHSWQDEQLKQQFDNADNFHSLRVAPYLITTGERHPDLKKYFWKEAERLKYHRQTLIHGDFSPKNIMIQDDRIVILDHEVAWFGDPAFDLAFFLNHLYLKMLFHFSKKSEIQDLTNVAWSTYFNKLDKNELKKLKERTGRLLLMMMLARVDGKSPVEYLHEKGKQFIRVFVHDHLESHVFQQAQINQNWKTKLRDTL